MSKFNVTAYDKNAIDPVERIEMIDTETSSLFPPFEDPYEYDVKVAYEKFWKDNRFGELITVSRVQRIDNDLTVGRYAPFCYSS